MSISIERRVVRTRAEDYQGNRVAFSNYISHNDARARRFPEGKLWNSWNATTGVSSNQAKNTIRRPSHVSPDIINLSCDLRHSVCDVGQKVRTCKSINGEFIDPANSEAGALREI